MKVFIFVLFALVSVNVSAGPYTDFGLGYIRSVPGKSESILEQNGSVIVRLDEKAVVRLDSPFLMLRIGYRWNSTNIHLEYNSFGVLGEDTQNISSWRLYKRFESRSGFYSDLGAGYVNDIPSMTSIETETNGPVILQLNQTATIDLDSSFPMVRIGYQWKSAKIHLEFERIGKLFNLSRSISTINVFKRWEFNL